MQLLHEESFTLLQHRRHADHRRQRGSHQTGETAHRPPHEDDLVGGRVLDLAQLRRSFCGSGRETRYTDGGFGFDLAQLSKVFGRGGHLRVVGLSSARNLTPVETFPELGEPLEQKTMGTGIAFESQPGGTGFGS